MSGRHRRLQERPRVNPRVGALGVAGLTGLAAALAAAPAHADPAPSVTDSSSAPDPTAPSPTDAPSSSDAPTSPAPSSDTPSSASSSTDPAPSSTDPAPRSTDPSPSTSTSAATPAPSSTPAPQPSARARIAAPVVPDFGSQKIRVGVQIKSGAYVPPGTTTAGTTITIVETGPSAGPSGTTTTTCQTQGSTIVPSSTASFCTFGEGPFAESFVVAPGDTATVTQTTVNANLVQDTTPQVVRPCVLQPTDGFVTCPPGVIGTDVVFTDPGVPPKADPDSATTVANHSVDVDVLANDQTGGAPATIDSVVQPAHGSVVIVPSTTAAPAAAPAATGPTLRYTPDPGYAGTDAFSYTMSTPNGSDSAKVDLTVTAPPPTASNDHAATTGGDPVTIRVLANDDANGGGTLSLESFSRPRHGTVTRDGNALVYTPAAAFAGTDTFTYTVSTPFGTATATVTVTVTAPPTSVQPTSTSTSTTATASTGADVEQGVELGAVLLLLGGASTALGRRRASGRHAG